MTIARVGGHKLRECHFIFIPEFLGFPRVQVFFFFFNRIKRREKGKAGVAESVNENDVVWLSISTSTVFGG